MVEDSWQQKARPAAHPASRGVTIVRTGRFDVYGVGSSNLHENVFLFRTRFKTRFFLI